MSAASAHEAPTNRLHPEQRTAGLDGAALDDVVERLGALEVWQDGEHRISVVRRDHNTLRDRARFQ